MNKFDSIPSETVARLAQMTPDELTEYTQFRADEQRADEENDAKAIGNDVHEFDYEPDPSPVDDEGWPHNDHTCMSDGDALASAGMGTDEDYGGSHGGEE